MNRIAGPKTSIVCWSRERPERAVALSLKRCRARAVGASWRFSFGDSRSAGTPASRESAIPGAAAASSRMPGRSSRNRVALFARNGRITGSVSVATAKVGGVSTIVSWIDGATAREGGERGVEVHEHLRLRLGYRGDLGGGGGDRDDEPLEPGLGSREVRHDGLEHLEGAGQLPESGVQVGPAAGQRVPELEQVRLDRRPRRRIEGVEEVVEVDRLRARRRERHDRAGGIALARFAPHQLQVLEAQGGPRPDDDRRVDRQLLDVGVELHIEPRVGLARLRVLLRLDRGDLADADAADPNLVARHELERVRKLGRDVV